MELNEVQSLAERLSQQIRKVVVGQDAALELLLIGLLVEGHVLLEGVPGTAKTMLVRAFAAALALAFGRIQFTPDLMPGDVLGTNLLTSRTTASIWPKGRSSRRS